MWDVIHKRVAIFDNSHLSQHTHHLITWHGQPSVWFVEWWGLVGEGGKWSWVSHSVNWNCIITFFLSRSVLSLEHSSKFFNSLISLWPPLPTCCLFKDIQIPPLKNRNSNKKEKIIRSIGSLSLCTGDYGWKLPSLCSASFFQIISFRGPKVDRAL